MDRLKDLTDYQERDDSSSRRLIVTYAVTAKQITVPAYNEDTEMPNLQTAKWELCGPMMTPLSQYYEAEKIFWDQNIIFVRGLEHVSKDLTVRFVGPVKKIWVNVGLEKAEMKPGELKREILRALKGCEALEEL